MTKLNQNFSMYAGDTKDITVTMSDSTSLTGSTINWALKKNVRAMALVTKSSTSGITISGTTFTIRLNSADTSALTGGHYHEAEVTDVSGNVSTVMIGAITIEPSGV